MGFEGGVAFSTDGKMIAYYASRPSGEKDTSFYSSQLVKEFADISKTEIYVYHLELGGKEIQASWFKKKLG